MPDLRPIRVEIESGTILAVMASLALVAGLARECCAGPWLANVRLGRAVTAFATDRSVYWAAFRRHKSTGYSVARRMTLLTVSVNVGARRHERLRSVCVRGLGPY